MLEEFYPIPQFPTYFVNRLGQVKMNKQWEIKTIGKNSRLNLDNLRDHKKITQKDFEFYDF